MEGLKQIHLEKADEWLRRALSEGPATKALTVVLVLDTGPEGAARKPSAADFASRAEWRRALASRMLARIREAVAGTLGQLRAPGLDPRGGDLGQTVVSGPPKAIEAALELPGVKIAVLDWDVGLFDWLGEKSVSEASPPAGALDETPTEAGERKAPPPFGGP